MNLTPLFFKDIPKYDNTTVLDNLYSLCYDPFTDKISLRKYGLSSNSPIVSHNTGDTSFSYLDAFDIYDIVASESIFISELTDEASYRELRFIIRNISTSNLNIDVRLFSGKIEQISLPFSSIVEISLQSYSTTRVLLYKIHHV